MYKLVLDMRERYYLECESPLELRRLYRKQLLPFARFLYAEFVPEMATEGPQTAFQALEHASRYFKQQYPSKR
jgi:hypothetical protein